MLDRTADELCRTFAIAATPPSAWGAWAQLGDLRPGHPAFVLRRTGDGEEGGGGLALDTQRWDISGGQACWPTTQILSVSLPWWRRLAERPAQRCLIPLTACTALLPNRAGMAAGAGRSAWFDMVDEPVFTVAGLWRDTGTARGFAMLGCLADAPFSILPVVIAPCDRDRWLDAPWDMAAPLIAPVPAERVRIGLPEPIASFYADGHDRPWAPAPIATVPGVER